MYEQFFQLNMKPFELVPNPGMLYLSRTHRKALSYLDYGFRERAGFILLTGEVGSGKTTIIRNLVKGLEEGRPRAMIFNTMVSADQLVAMINEEFGLDATWRDKAHLLTQLNDYLVEQYSRHSLPLLIIDEAQNLSGQALEEVRLLSNLETENAKLLQIVLVGQPELKEIIAHPSLRQLRQRISICCHLGPLSREETEEYILHRLEKAGNRQAVTFFPGTFDLIHENSGGIPRLINVYCDFILVAACVEETREITAEMVGEVIDDLNFSLPGCAKAAQGDGFGDEDQEGLKDSIAELQGQLGKHKTVIKKLIQAQQSQAERLEKCLRTIDNRLGALNRNVNRVNEVLQSGGVVTLTSADEIEPERGGERKEVSVSVS